MSGFWQAVAAGVVTRVVADEVAGRVAPARRRLFEEFRRRWRVRPQLFPSRPGPRRPPAGLRGTSWERSGWSSTRWCCGTTRYPDAALSQARTAGVVVNPEDIERLSPLLLDHVNVLGRMAWPPDQTSSVLTSP